MDFYIGSYTKMGGPGVGQCSLTQDSLSLVAGDPLPNATYVILNKAENRLFAICSDPVRNEAGGSAASYDISGGLHLLSRADTLGAGPCHLCLDAEERFLYTANYFTGSVSVFPVDEAGALGECIQHIVHTGHSVHPTRQTGPHAHQATFIPGTRILCVCDLGLDKLMLYDQDARTGLLSARGFTAVPEGLGPRHLLYARNGFTYLACEVGNRVLAMRWTGETFEILQSLSTLPEDYSEKNTASAIRETSDGKTLLVSNRGHNSIAAYAIESDGRLTLRGIDATGDDFPRDFALVDDHTLLIGHQNGSLRLETWTEQGLQTLSCLNVAGCVCVTLRKGN